MNGSIVLSLATAAGSAITDKSQIRLSRNPAGAKVARCARCSTRRSELALYRTGAGRVCRTCLAHVDLFLAPGASRGAGRRIPNSNGLIYPPAGSAAKLLQVLDPLADRNLAGAIVPSKPLPVTPADAPVPMAWIQAARRVAA